MPQQNRPRFKQATYVALLLTLVLTLLPHPSLARPMPVAVQQAEPTITYHQGTGYARFVRFAPGHELQVVQAAASQSAAEVAYGFLDQYGAAFGLQNPRRDLTVQRTTTLADGRSVTRFQQHVAGIPVLGGELVVQNRSGLVLSANGEVAPAAQMETTPAVSAADAQRAVLEEAAKHAQIEASKLTVTEPELWIYNPVLLDHRAPNVNRLVWRVEVQDETRLRVHQWVLVDAQSGSILFQVPLSMAYKNRTVYDNHNDTTLGIPGAAPVRTEGQSATGIADVDLVYDYMGDFYDFLQTNFGWDSYDNAGAPLVGVVRICESEVCPYENAFWNGEQLVFGEGLAVADDIVAHELTHALIEHTANLLYSYQSGAINESLADLFGEFIDQTNGAGNDVPAVKWHMGENASDGAVRNMADPTIFDDPDRKQSLNYSCAEIDLGGVHTNSGVNNKAAFLLTDGGAFNGHTITGLGLPKTARLYFEALTNHLTSASDYADLGDALMQAASSLTFSAAEQQTVQDVIDAVEMGGTRCDPPAEPALCPSNSAAQLLFWDDMEHVNSGNWRAQTIVAPNGWFYPSTENLTPGKQNVRNAASGLQSLWGDNQDVRSDSAMALVRDVTLPANAMLAFRHMWDFEVDSSAAINYDGGIVEYSVNGGASWTDAGSLVVNNGYTGAITNREDNPLANRQAYVGNSRGYTLTQLNLGSLSQQKVRFRFRVATDTGVGHWGWFVDDLMLYTCAPGNTAPFMATIPQQTLQQNGRRSERVDLWSYTMDMQEPSEALTYTLSSRAPISAGISLEDNRFLTVEPLADFTGSTTVSLLISDTGKLTTTASFRVVVRDDRLVHLPVVVKQEPVALPTDFFPVEETAIVLDEPDENFCPFTTVVAGNRYAALLKFNLSDVPNRQVIQHAQLSLYLVGAFDEPGKSRPVGLYRVTSPWMGCSVTWNTQPTVAEEFFRAQVPFGSEQWVTFDVTGLAQGWINGQLPNMGLLLKEVGAANRDESYREFLVSTLSDFPPTLTIQYQNGVVVSQQLQAPLARAEPLSTGATAMPLPSTSTCSSPVETSAMCLSR